MKITFLGHSGFEVVTEHYQLIFDYAEGPFPKKKSDKKTIFFVSHRHPDHFSSAIMHDVQSVSYVFSNDIVGFHADSLLQVCPYQQYDWQGVQIRTLKSTDEGVAFCVEADQWRIYHAGDLNWWHWKADTLQDEVANQVMEQRYRKEMNSLRSIHFDAAFLPLDPRLEEASSWGIQLFLKHAEADWIFPMHLWKCYDWIRVMKEKDLASWKKKIQSIQCEGQEFEVLKDEKNENQCHENP